MVHGSWIALKLARIIGKVSPWRVMVAAAVNTVAFTNVAGKVSLRLGINVAFKCAAAMVAARAHKAAFYAVVGLEGVAVVHFGWMILISNMEC